MTGVRRQITLLTVAPNMQRLQITTAFQSFEHVYLGFVWLCSLDKVVVPCLLLLISLHAERLVTFPQTRTYCVTPRPLCKNMEPCYYMKQCHQT